jgi:hypothetical protein
MKLFKLTLMKTHKHAGPSLPVDTHIHAVHVFPYSKMSCVHVQFTLDDAKEQQQESGGAGTNCEESYFTVAFCSKYTGH